jgi:hypothetical protein
MVDYISSLFKNRKIFYDGYKNTLDLQLNDKFTFDHPRMIFLFLTDKKRNLSLS